MSDVLDREATPEGVEEVERLLKATTAEIVPLPKSRPVPKTSTEVLAMPTLPALSVACHSAREPSPIRRSDPMSQFHDQSPTVEAALFGCASNAWKEVLHPRRCAHRHT
jgi:hypothetical protein